MINAGHIVSIGKRLEPFIYKKVEKEMGLRL